jgi:hypothetical protein
MSPGVEGRAQISLCVVLPLCPWLVGWLVGWLAGWLVGWLVCIHPIVATQIVGFVPFADHAVAPGGLARPLRFMIMHCVAKTHSD